MQDKEETPLGDTEKRKRWWPWVLGLLVLAAFCDDDNDDRPRQYCYDIKSGERRCFAEPLPEDQFCYLSADGKVRCYDQPL